MNQFVLSTALIAGFAITGVSAQKMPDLSGLQEAGSENESLVEAPVLIEERSYYPGGGIQEKQTVVIRKKQGSIIHGPFSGYREDGQLESQGAMVLGKRHGQWSLVSEGQALSEGAFRNGNRSGEWLRFDENQHLVEKAFYLDGELHGPRETFHQSGKRALEEFYVKGKLQGLRRTWHMNGELATETSWINGQEHGEHREWSASGATTQRGYFHVGVPHGNWEWRAEDGTVLRASQLDRGTGIWYEFQHTSGGFVLSKEIPMQRGKWHGAVRAFHPSGAPLSVHDYINGSPNGEFTAWFENGLVSEKGQFDDGSKTGTWRAYRLNEDGDAQIPEAELSIHSDGRSKMTEFGPDGELALVRELLGGRPHGQEAQYAPNGQVVLEGQNEAGLRTGTWVAYYLSGQVKSKQDYAFGNKHGVLHSWYQTEEGIPPVRQQHGHWNRGERHGDWQSFHPDGSLATKVHFHNGREEGEFVGYWPRAVGSTEQNRRAKGKFVGGKKHGGWLSWYENGTPASKELWHTGNLHGPFAQWFPGKTASERAPIRARGSFVHGEKDGLCQTFFEDGFTESAQYYRVGQLHGEISQNYPNHQPKARVRYENGVLEGAFLQHFPDGSMQTRGSYSGGLLNGAWEQFYEGGGEAAVRGEYTRGLPSKTWTWYRDNGRTVLAKRRFKDGTGKMLQFYPDGSKLRETSFVNGVQSGIQRQWHPNGKTHFIAHFNNGQLDGTFKEYHQNGEMIAQSEWKWGQRQGAFRSWFPDGSQRLLSEYRNDLMHGQAREWHETGQLRSSGFWKDGVRHGIWTWFTESGDVTFELNYNAGILMSSSSPQDLEDEREAER